MSDNEATAVNGNTATGPAATSQREKRKLAANNGGQPKQTKNEAVEDVKAGAGTNAGAPTPAPLNTVVEVGYGAGAPGAGTTGAAAAAAAAAAASKAPTLLQQWCNARGVEQTGHALGDDFSTVEDVLRFRDDPRNPGNADVLKALLPLSELQRFQSALQQESQRRARLRQQSIATEHRKHQQKLQSQQQQQQDGVFANARASPVVVDVQSHKQASRTAGSEAGAASGTGTTAAAATAAASKVIVQFGDVGRRMHLGINSLRVAEEAAAVEFRAIKRLGPKQSLQLGELSGTLVLPFANDDEYSKVMHSSPAQIGALLASSEVHSLEVLSNSWKIRTDKERCGPLLSDGLPVCDRLIGRELQLKRALDWASSESRKPILALAAGPGWGKSAFLDEFQAQLKQHQPDTLVVLVSFNNTTAADTKEIWPKIQRAEGENAIQHVNALADDALDAVVNDSIAVRMAYGLFADSGTTFGKYRETWRKTTHTPTLADILQFALDQWGQEKRFAVFADEALKTKRPGVVKRLLFDAIQAAFGSKGLLVMSSLTPNQLLVDTSQMRRAKTLTAPSMRIGEKTQIEETQIEEVDDSAKHYEWLPLPSFTPVQITEVVGKIIPSEDQGLLRRRLPYLLAMTIPSWRAARELVTRILNKNETNLLTGGFVDAQRWLRLQTESDFALQRPGANRTTNVSQDNTTMAKAINDYVLQTVLRTPVQFVADMMVNPSVSSAETYWLLRGMFANTINARVDVREVPQLPLLLLRKWCNFERGEAVPGVEEGRDIVLAFMVDKIFQEAGGLHKDLPKAPHLEFEGFMAQWLRLFFYSCAHDCTSDTLTLHLVSPASDAQHHVDARVLFPGLRMRSAGPVPILTLPTRNTKKIFKVKGKILDPKTGKLPNTKPILHLDCPPSCAQNKSLCGCVFQPENGEMAFDLMATFTEHLLLMQCRFYDEPMGKSKLENDLRNVAKFKGVLFHDHGEPESWATTHWGFPDYTTAQVVFVVLAPRGLAKTVWGTPGGSNASTQEGADVTCILTETPKDPNTTALDTTLGNTFAPVIQALKLSKDATVADFQEQARHKYLVSCRRFLRFVELHIAAVLQTQRRRVYVTTESRKRILLMAKSS